jgi:hypothetical protein
MRDRVCAATVTWARTEAEQQLLRTSLLRLAKTGLTIVVADRDSGPAFRAFLDSNAQFRVVAPLGPTLVGQVQASLSAALETGADFILYTESDKALFFRDGLEPFLDGAELGGRTGAVLAARTDDSFATFPPIQRLTERTINELCAELTGSRGDYSYGPFILNRVLVPHLADLAPDAGWGWRHFIFATAARLGYSVTHSVGDYPCPPDQRQEDRTESLHRMRQLEQNIRGLLLSETPAKR